MLGEVGVDGEGLRVEIFDEGYSEQEKRKQDNEERE